MITVLIYLAIVVSALVVWMASVAIVVPVVLILTYGRVELRTKGELRELSLREDPSNKNYPLLQTWTDGRGAKHGLSVAPRLVAAIVALFAPLALPLLPILALVWLGLFIVRWEADRINGRLDIRRYVRKMVLAREVELKKLVDEARQELDPSLVDRSPRG